MIKSIAVGGGRVPATAGTGLYSARQSEPYRACVLRFGNTVGIRGREINFQTFPCQGAASRFSCNGLNVPKFPVVLDFTDYEFGNPNDPSTLSGTGLLENYAFDAIGLTGPPGAIYAAGYSGLNAYYPGGFNQFVSDDAAAIGAFPGALQSAAAMNGCLAMGGSC